jgi:polysaccharide biosynthesis protein PslG
MQKPRKRYLRAGAVALALSFSLFFAWMFTRKDDPFQGAAVTNPPFTSITYSVQGFFWWDEGYRGLQLDWVNMLSFSHIKQTFAWRDMEPEPDVWTFHNADDILIETEKRKIKVIARLGQVPAWAANDDLANPTSDEHDILPQDIALWANYCRTVATRYAGRIFAYQIWNEPNLAREWGNQPPNAAEYVEILKACSDEIRAADPAAVIISAGLAPTGNTDASAMRDDLYLDAMYQAGFQQYVDVVGVHAPGFSAPEYGPDDAQKEERGRWFSFRRVEDLRKIMLQHGDAARQVAILEMGWTIDPVNKDYSWFAVDEQTQAEYMVRAFEYIHEHWSPWVGLVNIIYLPKNTWTEQDEEYWWAIALPNNHTRAVFSALVKMPKYCGSYTIPERQDLTEEGIRATMGSCP